MGQGVLSEEVPSLEALNLVLKPPRWQGNYRGPSTIGERFLAYQ
jgi:hypothetical protein